MTKPDPGHHPPSTARTPSGNANAISPPLFVGVVLTALVTAGVVYGLGGSLGGWGVGVVVAAGGAFATSLAMGKNALQAESMATALLDTATADDATSTPPAAFRAEPWASLYRAVAEHDSSRRTASMAVLELERVRRERDGGSGPIEPRPEHAPEDLVGGQTPDASDPDAPARWVPVSTPEQAAAAAEAKATAARAKAVEEALAPYREGLDTIETELDGLARSLQSAGPPAKGGGKGAPAAMVDALVQTAADGIEDLAAGLMRASELAGVAERVTNRATLLALNAALEATRSGSEAFASIAEETRRLAEYAREATDTISRLSNEIEFKVGETIASIHSSSEDAKAAVASLSGMTAAPPPAPQEAVVALDALRARVRALRSRLEEAPEPDAPEAEETGPPPTVSDARSGAIPDDIAESEDDGVSVVVVPPPDDEESTMDESPAVEAAHARKSPAGYGDVALEHDAPEESEAPPPTVDADPEEAGPSADGETPAPHGETPAPGSPKVVTKIPDWLEGLQPPGRPK